MPIKEDSLFIAPHSIDAEKAVLGSLLLDNQIADEIFGMLKAECFYLERHRKIYNAILDVYKETNTIDLISIKDYLLRRGELDVIGGIEYLTSLPDSVPSTKNAPTYAIVVKEKYVLRELISAANTITKLAYSEQGSFREIVDEAERIIYEVTEQSVKAPYSSAKEIINELMRRSEELNDENNRYLGKYVGIPTGFTEFDRRTSGLMPGSLNIIAARPGMGKTSLALNIAQYVGITLNNEEIKRAERLNRTPMTTPVLIFSLEMSKEELMKRMISSEAMVPADIFKRTPPKTEQERDELAEKWKLLHMAANRFYNAPIFIDDSGDISLLEIKGKCRRLKKEMNNRLGLVVVDYLQLLRPEQKFDSMVHAIADISRGLKILSKELEVPVIALSQLNRESEKRKESKRPYLSDLRESGAIEQDADVIIFIYRDSADDKDENEVIANVDVAKNRNGPTFSLKLNFHKLYTRFTEFAKVNDFLGHETEVKGFDEEGF
ncbi:MAG: replicative DNA helicase [Deltaproteobacteria bacterium]|nr:replicative DNA helicase [Deltaproteobacteria bacterium]